MSEEEEAVVFGAFRVTVPLEVVIRDTNRIIRPAEAYKCIVAPPLYYYHSLETLSASLEHFARIKYVYYLHRKAEGDYKLRASMRALDWMVRRAAGPMEVSPSVTEEIRSRVAAELAAAVPQQARLVTH